MRRTQAVASRHALSNVFSHCRTTRICMRTPRSHTYLRWRIHTHIYTTPAHTHKKLKSVRRMILGHTSAWPIPFSTLLGVTCFTANTSIALCTPRREKVSQLLLRKLVCLCYQSAPFPPLIFNLILNPTAQSHQFSFMVDQVAHSVHRRHHVHMAARQGTEIRQRIRNHTK